MKNDNTEPNSQPQAESHPLQPFLPEGAKLLMLGSFPPPRARWSMQFYYPNMQNDMWRIMGLVFFSDAGYFLEPGGKSFSAESLSAFLTERKIAIGDTARSVIRTRANASDQYLEIVEKIELDATLSRIPECRFIATTGGKATETLVSVTGSPMPPLGAYACFEKGGREIRHYRMPSTSRAYPRPLAEKAAVYEKMFRETGILK